MATIKQIKLQRSSNVSYSNGEAVLPTDTSLYPDPVPQLDLFQGYQPDGKDFGVVKVEDGKLVIDMADFNPDFGHF